MQAYFLTIQNPIRKIASSMLSAASQLIFAHKVALPSYLFVSRFSCEHEIRLTIRMAEVMSEYSELRKI